MKRLESINLNKRAQESIAHGALTNSKRPASFVEGVYPTHIRDGFKCYLNDVDGNRYIDFICGLGTNLVGYANPEIFAAVYRALRTGNSVFSLSGVEEVEYAETVKEVFPFIDRCRFLKSGSEGCSAAIRIARAYHGHDCENEDLQEMLHKEAVDRFSSQEKLQGRPSPRVQDLHQSVPSPTTYPGNKEGSQSKVLSDRQGQGDREESGEKEKCSTQEFGQGQSVLPGPQSPPLWGTHQATVRSMWERELSSPSSRLREALTRELAVPKMPQKGARWLILSDGYHGHADEFVSLMKPAHGVPPNFGIMPLTGNEHLIPIAAGVILEPIIVEYSDKRIKYLTELRQRCTASDTLLIFDETITAFRFPGYSVAKHLNILPDIWIGGKAIAGGMPLSVVGGRKDVMEADYFISSTWAGDRCALAAAIECNKLVHGDYNPEDLWTYGLEFLDKFNEISPHVQIEGYATRGVFKYKNDNWKHLFMQEMCKAGVLIGPSWFYNRDLHAEMDNVLSITQAVVKKINNGVVRIEGNSPKSPFAERVRHGKAT